MLKTRSPSRWNIMIRRQGGTAWTGARRVDATAAPAASLGQHFHQSPDAFVRHRKAEGCGQMSCHLWTDCARSAEIYVPRTWTCSYFCLLWLMYFMFSLVCWPLQGLATWSAVRTSLPIQGIWSIAGAFKQAWKTKLCFSISSPMSRYQRPVLTSDTVRYFWSSMAPLVFKTGRLACQFVLSCLTAAGADDPVTRWDMRLPMDASIYRALEEMLGKSAGDEVKLEESGSLNMFECPPMPTRTPSPHHCCWTWYCNTF